MLQAEAELCLVGCVLEFRCGWVEVVLYNLMFDCSCSFLLTGVVSAGRPESEIEGKIEGRIELKGGRGRKRKQLLDDLKETRG